ncbi:hypothetical protein T440DRAFT_245371 [Plenodomus tracheiphilus IPT5]|uniref:Uncharacterized protein n=1 Tax=Plenodomus tracheiphilus IPT5 TaxID=1408161 RepID=A0A6A7BHM4_9PLEO|nr:hypothetical protein T440DRAFT_245371 [Plenodomus tracheiphilus IPT5]
MSLCNEHNSCDPEGHKMEDHRWITEQRDRTTDIALGWGSMVPFLYKMGRIRAVLHGWTSAAKQASRKLSALNQSPQALSKSRIRDRWSFLASALHMLQLMINCGHCIIQTIRVIALQRIRLESWLPRRDMFTCGNVVTVDVLRYPTATLTAPVVNIAVVVIAGCAKSKFGEEMALQTIRSSKSNLQPVRGGDYEPGAEKSTQSQCRVFQQLLFCPSNPERKRVVVDK